MKHEVIPDVKREVEPDAKKEVDPDAKREVHPDAKQYDRVFNEDGSRISEVGRRDGLAMR